MRDDLEDADNSGGSESDTSFLPGEGDLDECEASSADALVIEL